MKPNRTHQEKGNEIQSYRADRMHRLNGNEGEAGRGSNTGPAGWDAIRLAKSIASPVGLPCNKFPRAVGFSGERLTPPAIAAIL